MSNDQPTTKRPSLPSRIEQVEQSLEEARSQLGLLFKFKDDHLKGLQRLSSQHGTTRSRVDNLTEVSADYGRQLARLTETLEQQKGRLEVLGEHMTDEQREHILTELTRVNDQAVAFTNDLQNQIDTFKQRVDQVEKTQNLHGPEIVRAHDRIDDVETAPMLDIDPATTAIELDGNVQSKTPWVKGIVAGALIGVMCFIALNTWADDWEQLRIFGFSVILGLAIMCLVASVETFQLSLNGRLLWGRHDRQRQEELNQTTVIPAVMPDDAHKAPYDQAADDQPKNSKQEVTA